MEFEKKWLHLLDIEIVLKDICPLVKKRKSWWAAAEGDTSSLFSVQDDIDECLCFSSHYFIYEFFRRKT